MLIGYARVSTDDQDLRLQRAALLEVGCKRVFEEKISGAKRDRPELARLVLDGRPTDRRRPVILLGVDSRTLKDATGKPFGVELYAAYQKPEGEITQVSYMFPRPGADKTPVPKVSLATRVGDLGCGVGYYKQ